MTDKPMMNPEEDELRLLLSRWHCGCEDPDIVGSFHEILKEFAKPWEQRRNFDDWADELLPLAPWQYLPLTVLDDMGLLEHGTSSRSGWLTDKGRAALAFIEKYGTDSDDWEESAMQHPAPAPVEGPLVIKGTVQT